ncbi:hypothetical protein [Microbacterium sp. bgisy189]|uniref:hypothetical protein n=1 Tax=Microbacterium sp. bgisy189 TaxID=3413798 RepID=UPI003EBB4745
MVRMRVAMVVTFTAFVGMLAACGPPDDALILGSTDGSVEICVGDFTEPVTQGEPISFSDGVESATLVRAGLVGADGVRVVEQAASRAVLRDDGTHLGVGTINVSEGDEAWDARVPLAGTVIENDGGETWFVALAVERTSERAGGFDAIELVYEVDGHEKVARGTQSMNFPARGESCDE